MDSLEFRKKVASLYCAAFAQKMQAMFGAKHHLENLLVRTMDTDMCLTKYIDGQLVGIVALDRHGKRFLPIGLRHCLSEYGAWTGLWRYLLLVFLDHRIQKGELFVDTLVIDEAFRGQKIGADLLASTEEFARQHRCATISLDVVDTNARAKSFYERQGFQTIAFERLPFWQAQLGFTGVYRMTKPLTPPPSPARTP